MALWSQTFTIFVQTIFPVLAVAFFLLLIYKYWKKWLNFFSDKNSFPYRIITQQPISIIGFVFLLYVLKTLFLVCKISQFNLLILLITIILHIVLFSVYYKNEMIKSKVISLATTYSVIAFSLIISTLSTDSSWDGGSYHQTAVIFLRDGWNPFYEVNPFGYTPDDFGMSVIHFPKFTWLFASVFVSIFGNIEVGKAYNLLIFVVAFFYALKIVSKYQKNGAIILCISLFLAANPVLLSQMFSYYVDGFFASLMLILVFALMDFEECSHFDQRGFSSIKDGKFGFAQAIAGQAVRLAFDFAQAPRSLTARNDTLFRRFLPSVEMTGYLFIIFAVCVISINTKFTGFACGVVLLAYLFRQIFLKNYKNVLKLTATGVCILLFGVLFTGFNPYIKNYQSNQNILYPLYGKDAHAHIPPHPYVQNKNVIQIFASYFFHANDNKLRYVPFNPDRIHTLPDCYKPDKNIGGFGIFLYEISLLIMVITIFSICSVGWKKYTKPIFAASIFLILMLIMPVNWWARIVPFFWYVPILLLMPANFKKMKVLSVALFMLIAVNNFIFLYGCCYLNHYYGAEFQKLVNGVKQSKSENIVVVIYFDYFKVPILDKLRHLNIDKNIEFTTQRVEQMHSIDWHVLGWYEK